MVDVDSGNGVLLPPDVVDGGSTGLLGSADTCSFTTGSTSFGKYRRSWRVTISITILISVNRPTSFSSIPYVARTSSTRDQHVIDIPSFMKEVYGDESHRMVKKVVKKRDVYLLEQFGGVAGVARSLGSDLVDGVDGGEDTQRSVVWNTSHPVHVKPFCFYFKKACNSYTNVLLLIAAGFSFGVEMVEQKPLYGWHDGTAILVAMFLLLLFPSVGDFRRAKKMQKLQRKRNELKVNVRRRGQDHQIPVSDLLTGDLVHLREGDIVLTDGLFVRGHDLKVDEVMDSEINTDTNPFLCYGSKVVQGNGTMLVVSMAEADTESGLAIMDSNERTLFEAHIDKPNSSIDVLALFVSVLIALIALINLLTGRQHGNDKILPELKGKISAKTVIKIFESIFLKPRRRVLILTGALTAVVIGIQHGVPFVITISLSWWTKKLESVGVMLRNLSSFGGMSLVTVICMNATGWETDIQVEKFLIGDKEVGNGVESETNLVFLKVLRRGIGALGNVPHISISRTNNLLISWANSRWDMDMQLLDQHFSFVKCRRLTSKNIDGWVLLKGNGDDENVYHVHLHGAASVVLKLCSYYYDSKGGVRGIEKQRRKFEQAIRDMEDNGLRVIALACKQTASTAVVAERFRLVAMVGLRYSCEDETKSTVEALRDLGVRIKLVSHDELSVARAIACDLGIFRPGSEDVELEGDDIHSNAFEEIEKVNLMRSCLSGNKLKMVQSLQQKGHVVAFLGGLSATDAAALKEADVGITMVNQGTELARERCDIVLSDHASLLALVKYGRYVYYNIQKFTKLQVTSSISGLMINLVSAMFLWDSPLTPVQLVWINFIMYILGGLMMVMELGSQAIPITNRNQSLLTKSTWQSIGIQVFYQATLLLVLHLVGKATTYMNEEVWKSLVFNSFTLCQVFNQFNAMDLQRKEVTRKIFLHSYWFLLALGSVMVMQVVFLEFAEGLAGCTKLSMALWALSFMIAALSWGFDIAVKCISASISSAEATHLGSSRRRRLSWTISWLVMPCSCLLLLSISYCFVPNNVLTFR